MFDSHSAAQLSEMLDRLEALLDRVEQRLEETGDASATHSFQVAAVPFLSDELAASGDLFSTPSFEIGFA